MQPPVDKLPLLVRKNLRDDWGNKKEELDKRLSDILGETWSFTVNPELIYANCDSGQQPRIGTIIYSYAKSFLDNLQKWVKEIDNEDDSKDHLNTICPRRMVELHPQDSTEFVYGGIEFKDHMLRIVYSEGNFWVNIGDITAPNVITKALDDAIEKGAVGVEKPALNRQSRKTIHDCWQPRVDKLREEIAEACGIPDIQINPNFEENVAKLNKWLKANPSDYEHRRVAQCVDNIGNNAKLYFEALKDYLTREKIGADDMLQEAFAEAVSTKTIGLRVVDKLEIKTYNETVIKDGVAWMQSTPPNWMVNATQIGDSIIDLL